MKTSDRLASLLKRLEKAEQYMDRPYVEKWTGKKLEDGIDERMKHVPILKELIKEVCECMEKLSKK